MHVEEVHPTSLVTTLVGMETICDKLQALESDANFFLEEQLLASQSMFMSPSK
jgi:hypothetical protein